MKFRTSLIALLLAAPTAFAAPITVSSTQNITATKQGFSFSLAGLPAAGKQAKFSVVLNGDYTTGIASEYATLVLENSGYLTLGGGWNNTKGVGSNTVSGLTVDSYTVTNLGYSDDIQRSWVFSLTDGLFKTFAADKAFNFTVQNSAEVNNYKYAGADFVSASLKFEPVPEPTSLALSGLGLALVGLARRRRKSA